MDELPKSKWWRIASKVGPIVVGLATLVSVAISVDLWAKSKTIEANAKRDAFESVASSLDSLTALFRTQLAAIDKDLQNLDERLLRKTGMYKSAFTSDEWDQISKQRANRAKDREDITNSLDKILGRIVELRSSDIKSK